MAEANQETPKSPFVRYINTSKNPDPQKGVSTEPTVACEMANIHFNRGGSSQEPEPRQVKPEEDQHLYTKSGEPGTSSVKGGPASKRATTLETERQRERASGREREERERASGREREEREREMARRRQREQREKEGARRREREDRWPPPRVVAAMSKQMSELSEDIRRMKAVLVKQEKRIRAIEAAVDARMAAAAPSPVPPDM